MNKNGDIANVTEHNNDIGNISLQQFANSTTSQNTKTLIGIEANGHQIIIYMNGNQIFNSLTFIGGKSNRVTAIKNIGSLTGVEIYPYFTTFTNDIVKNVTSYFDTAQVYKFSYSNESMEIIDNFENLQNWTFGKSATQMFYAMNQTSMCLPVFRNIIQQNNGGITLVLTNQLLSGDLSNLIKVSPIGFNNGSIEYGSFNQFGQQAFTLKFDSISQDDYGQIIFDMDVIYFNTTYNLSACTRVKQSTIRDFYNIYYQINDIKHLQNSPDYFQAGTGNIEISLQNETCFWDLINFSQQNKTYPKLDSAELKIQFDKAEYTANPKKLFRNVTVEFFKMSLIGYNHDSILRPNQTTNGTIITVKKVSNYIDSGWKVKFVTVAIAFGTALFLLMTACFCLIIMFVRNARKVKILKLKIIKINNDIKNVEMEIETQKRVMRSYEIYQEREVLANKKKVEFHQSVVFTSDTNKDLRLKFKSLEKEMTNTNVNARDEQNNIATGIPQNPITNDFLEYLREQEQNEQQIRIVSESSSINESVSEDLGESLPSQQSLIENSLQRLNKFALESFDLQIPDETGN